ncbi:NTP transferase domain-containing protein [bacterium]|nr:NTP transferase domain-containing protein [bacterium]
MASGKRKTIAVILAAGKGTRMKSDLPKVLHPLMGKPLVDYVIQSCSKAGASKMVLVIGHQADRVMDMLGPDYTYVEQKEQLGTGHAVMVCSETLKSFKGDLLVLAGDTPFLTARILSRLIRTHQKTGAAATMMTAIMDPPLSYGRIVRDDKNRIQRIVEARDASREEKKICEVNTSHYCFRAEKLFPCLDRLSTNNDQGEYYLTDVIQMLVEQGETVESLTSDDPGVLMGINSRVHLAEAHEMLGRQIKIRHMENGVTLPDPASVYIEPDVRIGADTVIGPGTVLLGTTRIGPDCIIGPHVKLLNADIGEGCKIEFSVIEHRKIARHSVIGPMAFMLGNNE